MSKVILLDAGPLGFVTNPKVSPESIKCAQWIQRQLEAKNRVVIPEITDYEVRRELLRANKVKGISRLDNLAKVLEYLPLTTAAMRQAARQHCMKMQFFACSVARETVFSPVVKAIYALILLNAYNRADSSQHCNHENL